MPAKLFVSVELTTKTEPTPNNPLVLDNTRYQRNSVMQPLAAQLGIRLWAEDRHAVFGTGVRARTAPMLALLRVHGIHLTRRRQGQVCHFCHKQWITSRHTGTSGE